MLKNIVFSVSTKFSNIAFKLILTIFIARILGPGGFGVYSLYLSLSAAFTLLLLFGSQNFLLNRSKNKASIRKYNNTFRKYYFVLFLLVNVIVFPFLFINNNILDTFILTSFFSIQFLFFVYQYQFMALNFYKNLIKYNIIYYLIILILSITFQPTSYTIYLSFYTIGGIGAILYFRKFLIPKTLRFTKFELLFLKLQIKTSKRNFLLDMNSIIQQRLDFFVLYLFGGNQIAGIYAAVKNISESILYLPKSIQPIIIQEKDDSRLYPIIKIVNIFLFLISIIGLISSEIIMNLVFGETYSEGVIILKISFIIIYIYSLTILISSDYIRLNLQLIAIKKNVISTILMVCILAVALSFKNVLYSVTIGVLISYILLLLLLLKNHKMSKNLFKLSSKDLKNILMMKNKKK